MAFSNVTVTLNGNTYNDNSFLDDGHQTAFLQSLSDFLVEADAVSTAKTDAEQAETNAAMSASNAATSETNAANSADLAEDWAIDSTISGGSAKEWATRAEDDSVPGGGGLFSAFHYTQKAIDAKNDAEAAAVSTQFPVYTTSGTGSAYTITDSDLNIADGAAIRINFHDTNSASPTLEETTEGTAREIVDKGNRSLDAGEISTGATFIAFLDTSIGKWILLGLELTKLVGSLDANGQTISNGVFDSGVFNGNNKYRTYDDLIQVRGAVDAVTDQHVVQFRRATRMHNIEAATTTGTLDITLKKNGTGINFGGTPSTTVSVTSTLTEHAVNETNAYIDFAAGDTLEIDRSNISGAENFECYMDWEDR